MKQRLPWSRRARGCVLPLALLVAAISVLDSGAAHQISSASPPNTQLAEAAPEFALLGLPAQPAARDFLRVRMFQEPLVPLGEPTADQNTALAAALAGYSTRQGPDDFSSLTHFLDRYPRSPWAVALLTDLGLEYYNTAHYSLALNAWERAWELSKVATDPRGKAVCDRSTGELAYMYARLGRMTELEALLKSVDGRVFVGPATEKIAGAREGLWSMQHRPGISFKCGPFALQKIIQSDRRLMATFPATGMTEIFNAFSTQTGFSLVEVAALSRKIGLNYQMAFRQAGGEFVFPSVVHWKVGHYAAMVRREGDCYLLQDPTFGNAVWATRRALEEETSGYFLIPPGPLPQGWRSVVEKEGQKIRGKGQTASNDPKPHGCSDPHTGGSSPCTQSTTCCNGTGTGMAVSSVHLMLVNLNLTDRPVGYSPPVGPDVRFTVRYNHRDAFQPTTFTYSNFGPKWTCDWIAYITDNPSNALADVNYYMRGGGTRTFTGFDTNAQTYNFQQFDATQLKRTGPASYEMLWPDGAKLVFGASDGSTGTSRKIFLTQVLDPFGNAVTLSYDGDLRLTAITDAIGQITTLSYDLTDDIYKITKVTDPFGRFASFNYDSLGRLTNITDVIGITSNFGYETNSDFITALITPYGTNTFVRHDDGNTRRLDTFYPDGSQDRVEYNQSGTLGIQDSDPPVSVPQGMATTDQYLYFRNTYYWSRNACAQANGDYTKAKIYHWLHDTDGTQTSGILESTKEALERRVWMDYAGQSGSINVGPSNKPLHIGRVLDDGSTQLYTYGYNGFGHVTSMVDPVGRTFSCIYATNGIDLLEIRMTRAGKNELLYSATYNSQHLPLTITDAAGWTTTNTYNARGQLLTSTDPKNETATFVYDTNGYLIAVDGPLPGTNDTVTATYDSYGRIRTNTDVSGYTLIYDYDALDRITRITHPDATFERITYNLLDPSVITDRAGRQTLLEHDSMRHLARRTDPLGRVTRFEWCSCGDLKTLIDPLGRATTWNKDVQSRLVSKQYCDGSQVVYNYENTISRLREVVDERQQRSQYTYNLDNTVRSVAYANTTVTTPGVTYTYDPEYVRRVSMTDGIGTTTYSYNPVGSLGALGLASVSGPWPNETVTYFYDVLGLVTNRSINGVAQTWTRDPLGRITNSVNALGSFTFRYAGATSRVTDVAFPGGQTSHFDFFGLPSDPRLQKITHLRVDSSLISQFTYGYDIIGNITNWVQQLGSYTETWAAGYDDSDRLISVLVDKGGTNSEATSYSYDSADNRLIEKVNGIPTESHFNALNELVSIPSASPTNTTYEWDGRNRLRAIVQGGHRSEFAYDGRGRLRQITEKDSGTVANEYRFTWCARKIFEERDTNSTVVARFFGAGEQQGGKNLYYCLDHLGSTRELTDSGGATRAEYSYSPFGIKMRRQGDLESAFGFTHLLNHQPSATLLAVHRVYDPRLARWLNRDPIGESGGLNLFGYVGQNPVNRVDRLGLDSGIDDGGYDNPDALYSLPDEEPPPAQEQNTCELGEETAEFLASFEFAEKVQELSDEMEDEEDSEGIEKIAEATGDTGFSLDVLAQIAGKHSRLGEFFEKYGGRLDMLESGLEVFNALKHPTKKNFFKAGKSCGETYLILAAPEVGLPLKGVELLNDVLPPPAPEHIPGNMEYEVSHRYLYKHFD